MKGFVRLTKKYFNGLKKESDLVQIIVKSNKSTEKI